MGNWGRLVNLLGREEAYRRTAREILCGVGASGAYVWVRDVGNDP